MVIACDDGCLFYLPNKCNDKWNEVTHLHSHKWRLENNKNNYPTLFVDIFKVKWLHAAGHHSHLMRVGRLGGGEPRGLHHQGFLPCVDHVFAETRCNPTWKLRRVPSTVLDCKRPLNSPVLQRGSGSLRPSSLSLSLFRALKSRLRFLLFIYLIKF